MSNQTLYHIHTDLYLPQASASEASALLLEGWEKLEHHPLRNVKLTAKQRKSIEGFIHFIGAHSRYLLRLLELHPEVLNHFIKGDASAYCTAFLDDMYQRRDKPCSIEEGKTFLRLIKRQYALMVALADLSAIWSLSEVTDYLSDLADAAVSFALAQSYHHALPASALRGAKRLVEESGIAVLGMGKLGGRELNYSSDIDLIVIYEPQKLEFLAAPARNRFAVRVVQQLASYLQDRDETGYVFRVDLRLRPDPASTSLAVAYDTALRYYEQVGQNWERAAMIKARAIAGDFQIGDAFISDIQSFIWRNHLDFAAIDDILSIKRQMHAKQEPDITLAGHHLKTGYGGIREIEFLAQIHQLIWGGRIPELRIKATCSVLDALVAHELMDEADNTKLQEAYYVFRTVEHRLQMRMDQQTHRLPESQEGLDDIAAFYGMERAAFDDALMQHLSFVHDYFNTAFDEATPLGYEGKLVFTGVDHDQDTLNTLTSMGYTEPEDISSAIQSWHKGHKQCIRTKRARELLTELVPLILQELAHTVEPDQAFKRFDLFLDALPVGVQPFSLFHQNHALLSMVIDIIGNAPMLARQLSSYPQLLDGLVQRSMLPEDSEDHPLDVFAREPLTQELRSWLSLAPNEEAVLEYFAMFAIEHEFLIGVELLEGEISAHEASLYLTRLVDVMIHEAIEMVSMQLSEKYPHQQGTQFGLIALGKLGTSELMFGSDLDVMCVYDLPGAESLEPDAVMELTQYYNRLTTRVINMLSHPTKLGPLYEMDTKLRPYGAQGAVAVKLSAFSEYYVNAAWMVENLALYQARIIHVHEPMEKALHQALHQAQYIRSEPNDIAEHIDEVRRKICEQHYSSNPWDIKYVWGGLMDVQWVVKAHLAHASIAHALPEVPMNTAQHIDWLHEMEMIDADRHETLLQAHHLFHTVLSYLRLCHGDVLEEENITEGLKTLLVHYTGAHSFQDLQQSLLRTQAQIYQMVKNLAYLE